MGSVATKVIAGTKTPVLLIRGGPFCLPRPDWLRRIGLVHFGHINLRGTMRFGVEKFSESLLRENSGEAASFKLR